MIDFHTHVLPGMDDGSRSVEESLSMLESMREQGVSRVIATPHFYANDESVESFLNRRSEACERLLEHHGNEPKVLLGAEVRYYPGISHLADLHKLQIENSKFLLLEMPFCEWTEYFIKEVEDIAARGRVTLVLAHIERYLAFQKKGTLERLLGSGVLIQSNASFFDGVLTRRRAVRMVRDGMIHFIGSDAHNTSERAPNTSVAIEALTKRLGAGFVSDFIDYENELFSQNQTN